MTPSASPRVRRRVRPVAAWLMASLALAACSDGDAPAPDDRFPTGERFVSLLTPQGRMGRVWGRESRLPKEPQASPWMVIYEVSRYPNAKPTPEQQAAADELVRRSREAAERHGWFDFLKGLSDGYQPAIGDETHYENEAYILDDRVLDPDRPEFLMYYDTPQGKRLAGVMYYVRNARDEGPAIGGPLTVWHYHIWARAHCLKHGLVAAGVADRTGRCKQGVAAHRSPEMLHVWFVDHPNGPFATTMKLPPALLRDLAWD